MYRHYIKRVLDFLISLLALPFIFIILLIVAPFIYFTDKGPIFYNANRVGKNGKIFRMFKLRSMYVNAPDLRNEDGSTFNSDEDPRVTPIGRFLRKTSIDELPQIFNVLIGDMSFVGPRPTLFNKNIDYGNLSDELSKRFSVRPGITGYAQAYYRNSIGQAEKFHWDAYYSDHLSFVMDIKILWKTFISVLAHENINTK